MMEEDRMRQQRDRDENREEKLERESEEELRGRVTWADMKDGGDFEGGETYVELGRSIGVVEEWDSKQGERQAARSKAGWRSSRKRQSRGETDEK